jgi:RNA-splicing ligase RtcB
MELKGKYGTAVVHTDEIESGAISQIISLLNQPMAQDAHVRIMPDVHAGAGCVIGYTAKLTRQTVPNLIGVDIGCGVTAWKLGSRSEVGEKFDKLDKFIRKNIPSGRKIRDEEVDVKTMASIFHTVTQQPLEKFDSAIKEVCKNTGQSYDYVWRSLGTLGGGNHFIEIDKDDDDNLWLVVHSGSRNFGLKVATYHQGIAKKLAKKSWTSDEIQKIVGKYKGTKDRGLLINAEIAKLKDSKPKIPTGLEYLEYKEADAYFEDMKLAQLYAQVNRRLIGYAILTRFYNLKYKDVELVESVHNYINFQDKIVRKGAISAHEGERVLIPLNMADGVIVGTGKGNEDWNFSAPHGAGRKMSRKKAKEAITLDSFQKIMKAKKVWTSTADKHTLDEAPQAYKRAEHIIGYLKDTVDIEVRMKPVYNFKSQE